MKIKYTNTQGQSLEGEVVFVHPQTGELLVKRADNGRREYVNTKRVTG